MNFNEINPGNLGWKNIQRIPIDNMTNYNPRGVIIVVVVIMVVIMEIERNWTDIPLSASLPSLKI